MGYTARERVRHLIHVGNRLSRAMHDEIVAMGEAAIPPLIEILEDERLHMEDGPGKGMAAVHAAGLLGDLRATAAIPVMLRALEKTEWLDYLHDRVLVGLGNMGAPALEPCLRAYAETKDEEFRDALACVLACLGVRDDRILTVLIERLEEEPGLIASSFVDYGDPSALPHLSRAFDQLAIVTDGASPLVNQDAIELAEAVEKLGGTLTDAQQAKMRRAMAPRERYRRQLDAALYSPRHRPPVIGKLSRNDSCHCGSGKKYKKCHLPEEEARGTA